MSAGRGGRRRDARRAAKPAGSRSAAPADLAAPQRDAVHIGVAVRGAAVRLFGTKVKVLWAKPRSRLTVQFEA
jgi:hypothetical protein